MTAKQWQSYRANFKGKLANIEVEDLKLKVEDYDIRTFESRKKVIQEKLKKIEPFFNEYFYIKETDKRDNGDFKHLITENDLLLFFNYRPNKKEELSFDINICKFIESYASYLLNSIDLPKDKQYKYTVLGEEEFKKQLDLENKCPVENNSFIVLDTRPKNKYTNTKLTINESDIDTNLQSNPYGIRESEEYLAIVLKSYNDLKNLIKEDMNKLKAKEITENGFSLLKIRKLLADINDDMLLCKKKILSLRNHPTKLGNEKSMYDFSSIDYSNPKHIQFILKFCRMGKLRPNDPMSEMAYDLQVAVRKLELDMKLDSLDMEIIQCYNTGTYSFNDIAIELCRSKATIKQRIYKICKRIAKIM